MKKMPCVFVRDFDARPAIITAKVTLGCEWVIAGEGEATRKWDGTASMIQAGQIYARYDCKRGKAPPPSAIPCDPEPDPVTGHWPHWILVAAQPEYRWHKEALDQWTRWWNGPPADGTYEVIGPKIGGNPENQPEHLLRRHGDEGYIALNGSRTQEIIATFLAENIIEGLVFHHPDGRMAKIRRGDFGLPWPVRGEP